MITFTSQTNGALRMPPAQRDGREVLIESRDIGSGGLPALNAAAKATLELYGTAIITPDAVARCLPHLAALRERIDYLADRGLPEEAARTYSMNFNHSFCSCYSAGERDAPAADERVDALRNLTCTAEVLDSLRSLSGIPAPLSRARLEILGENKVLGEHDHHGESFSAILHVRRAVAGGQYRFGDRRREFDVDFNDRSAMHTRYSWLCESGTLLLSLGTTVHQVVPVLEGIRRTMVWHFQKVD